MRDSLEHMKAGFAGKDEMRNRAKEFLGNEMGSTFKEPTMPESFSSRDNERMRLYRRGGKVKHHPMPHEQHDLHIGKVQHTRRVRTPRFEDHEGLHKAHGGTIYEKEMVGEHHTPRRSYEADMRGEHPKHRPMEKNPRKNALGGPGHIKSKAGKHNEQHHQYKEGGMNVGGLYGQMKKGGHTKKHKMNMGGIFDRAMINKPSIHSPLSPTFKKGGKHHVKRAIGGSGKMRKGMI